MVIKQHILMWETAHAGLISGLPVRFFVLNDELDTTDEGELIETSLFAFMEVEGEITMERHTMSENGCNQICLTKMPKG